MTTAPAAGDEELIARLRAKLESDDNKGFEFCCDCAPATFAELRYLLDRLAATNARAERLQKELTFAAMFARPDREMNGIIASLKDANDRAEAAEAKLAEVERMLTSISVSVGTRFMDPPDGGDVTLAEQVQRMREALAEVERQLHDYQARVIPAETGIVAAEARIAAYEYRIGSLTEAIRGALTMLTDGSLDHPEQTAALLRAALHTEETTND